MFSNDEPDQCIGFYHKFNQLLTEANHSQANHATIDLTVKKILFQMLSEFVAKQKVPINEVHEPSTDKAVRDEQNTCLFTVKDILDDYEVRERNFYLAKFKKFHTNVKQMGENSLAYILKTTTVKLKDAPLMNYNAYLEAVTQDMVELCRGTMYAFRSITAVFKLKYFKHNLDEILNELNTELNILFKIFKSYQPNEPLSQLDAIRLGSQAKVALFLINFQYFIYEFEERRKLSFRSLYNVARSELFFIDAVVESGKRGAHRALNEEWNFLSVQLKPFEDVKAEFQKKTANKDILPSSYDRATTRSPAFSSPKPSPEQAEINALRGRV